MTVDSKTLLRSLPSLSTLLEHEEVAGWLTGLPRVTVVAALRVAVDEFRQRIITRKLDGPVAVEDLLACAEDELVRRTTPSLRRVINATGIVLHTGLGRAPLCDAAIEAIVEGASGYCNLEFDLATGQRGRRVDHVGAKVAGLLGAEAATVVNNNAAATLLILQVMAEGREAIVSRGQLIEIGGSFRLPDIMMASGARLREVGTTNRTRITDYERAINTDTAVLMRVHTSNYRVIGFAEEVGMAEMADLARRHNLVSVDDLGSGLLDSSHAVGLPHEPCARDSIDAGADLVCFSGDKLLGGPQCGIIVGRRDLIDRIESHPLMRTYRVDKLVLLALEATLDSHVDHEQAMKELPTAAMLATSTEVLSRRAHDLVENLNEALPQETFLVGSSVGYAGGGSMPQRALDSVVIQWRPTGVETGKTRGAGRPRWRVDHMMALLRQADVPVIAMIRDDAISFDLRTIGEGDFECLVASVTAAFWDAQPGDDTNPLSLPVVD